MVLLLRLWYEPQISSSSWTQITFDSDEVDTVELLISYIAS